MKKELLLIIDYQNDFVKGPLGFEEARLIENPICERMDKMRASNGDIAFTMDTHSPDYLQTQEGRKLPIPHCIEGTEGWELYGKVAKKKRPEDILLTKNTFGCLKLIPFLQERKYEKITLAGVVSHICVITNALLSKTALEEAEICIDMHCCAGSDPLLHKEALHLLSNMQVNIL